MTSLILQTAARFLLTLMLLFSVFLLLRGHDLPGGGFIGGLVASSAFALYAFAYGVTSARGAVRLPPQQIIAVGLLIALLSGAGGLLEGLPYLTPRWVEFDLPAVNQVKLGTPLLFDVGVYFVVIGVVLLIMFNLAEE
jgi:multicomponent Na+:H+ antiporter subunit B